MKRACVLSLVLFLFLQQVSFVQAEEKSKDTLYGIYSAVKIGMTVDKVRDIVNRLGTQQDKKEIPESLEQSRDSTQGSLEERIMHKATKDNGLTDTYLTLIFLSDGYNVPLTLASARWEKRTHGGSSLEYSKRKGR